jgi:hypothetical protein
MPRRQLDLDLLLKHLDPDLLPWWLDLQLDLEKRHLPCDLLLQPEKLLWLQDFFDQDLLPQRLPCLKLDQEPRLTPFQ